ncbi:MULTISPECIES: hypothetical protein [unclassified Rhizobium]|uniref:hypothetical protein n=1 Tax=unclassified Rhizobium TaxID=2613769 RepID=UPI0025FDF8CB|nr:hypothetical protein [Rhizobium sp. UBA1881]
MSITYPYPVADFADLLQIESVVWDIKRNDELSGTGDGRVFQAELAPPLWVGTVVLNEGYHDTLKQVAAKIRKLHGSQEALFLYDPTSKYPQFDPTGEILGAANVQVVDVGSNRDTIRFKGLPVGYRFTTGDKLQIAYGSSPTRHAFIEISEDAIAASDGTTDYVAVFPHVPPGVVTNLSVVLKKPACRCIMVPGSHNPGTASGLTTKGAGFRVVQKK